MLSYFDTWVLWDKALIVSLVENLSKSSTNVRVEFENFDKVGTFPEKSCLFVINILKVCISVIMQ